jgi:predicted RNA-binding Zn-ribbon protein involved in translation (DUF1610 family)
VTELDLTCPECDEYVICEQFNTTPFQCPWCGADIVFQHEHDLEDGNGDYYCTDQLLTVANAKAWRLDWIDTDGKPPNARKSDRTD